MRLKKCATGRSGKSLSGNEVDARKAAPRAASKRKAPSTHSVFSASPTRFCIGQEVGQPPFCATYVSPRPTQNSTEPHLSYAAERPLSPALQTIKRSRRLAALGRVPPPFAAAFTCIIHRRTTHRIHALAGQPVLTQWCPPTALPQTPRTSPGKPDWPSRPG